MAAAAAPPAGTTGTAPRNQARSYCFTLATPTEAELAHLDELAALLEAANPPDHLKFIGGQVEVAPTTGLEHVQGYIGFTTKKTMAQVKRVLGPPRYLTYHPYDPYYPYLEDDEPRPFSRVYNDFCNRMTLTIMPTTCVTLTGSTWSR